MANGSGDVSLGVPTMLERYKGSLLGALAGDCIGRVFERPRAMLKSVEVPKIVEAIAHHLKNPVPPLPYTDDTAMAHALIESLLRCERVDLKDVAKAFTTKYYSEKSKQRMYAKVRDVFKAWRESNYAGDIFGPSKAQFDGSGSLGNGGGMRIVGVPLFFGDDVDQMVEAARTTTQLTHFNVLGYNGAILEAYAVYLALRSSTPDAFELLKTLTTFCETLEKDENNKCYTEKLHSVRKLLQQDVVTKAEAVNALGHSVKAPESIPMAIYCALRAFKPIEAIQTDSVVGRTVIYAISMGGDTDTIATMAGAIAGAACGVQAFPEKWSTFCEASAKTVQLAESLHAAAIRANERGNHVPSPKKLKSEA